MVEAAVHTSEDGSRGMLHLIHTHQQHPGLAHQELARFEPDLYWCRAFRIETGQSFTELLAQVLDVGTDVVGLVRHLEAATEIKEGDARKGSRDLQDDLGPL